MRNIIRVLVVALVATTFVLSGGPAGALASVASDPATDSSPYDARGDLTNVGVNYSAARNILLVAKTASPVNPATDYNWIYNSTAIIWNIDVNGDDQEDWWVIVMNFNGVKASVWRTGGSGPVCSASPSFDTTLGVKAYFPASCIGNPASFSISVGSLYDTGTSTSTFDSAPNGSGYCCSVTPSDAASEPPPTTTTTTTQPPPTTTTTTQPPTTQPDPPVATAAVKTAKSGYAMVTSDGDIHNFGDAPYCHNAPGWNDRDVSDIDVTPDGKGYWVLQSHGYVEFIDCGMSTADYLAYEHNNLLTLNTGEKAVSLSATPDGSGYWVFTDRGRALNFGTAKHRGDMGGVRLSAPVLDSVATPTGLGYWMVAADGGIFTFGDAAFAGSTGAIKLNQPVMSMAADPDGAGYWLVAADGGIFAFDAPFYGSLGGIKLNKPVSGIVPGSAGYLMVAEDGGIFSFGSVAFHGSLGANPPPFPVVAVSLLH